MSVVLEGSLDEELGYSKYEYQNKETDIIRIADKILPIVKEWQERPLEEVYTVVLMPSTTTLAVKGAVYISLGIDMNGHKDVLGMYVVRMKVQSSSFPL